VSFIGCIDLKGLFGRWAAHNSQTFRERIAKPAWVEVGLFFKIRALRAPQHIQGRQRSADSSGRQVEFQPVCGEPMAKPAWNRAGFLIPVTGGASELFKDAMICRQFWSPG
jgi:hypothetical protein